MYNFTQVVPYIYVLQQNDKLFCNDFLQKILPYRVNVERVNIWVLKVDEILLNNLIVIANQSINDIAKLTKNESYNFYTNQVDFNKDIKSLFWGIYSELYWSDLIDKFTDILELVSWIFSRVVVTHNLFNGNKRFSFCFLKNFLWCLGYYLKFTRGKTYIEWNKNEYENWLSKIILAHHEKNDIMSIIRQKINIKNILLRLAYEKTNIKFSKQ